MYQARKVSGHICVLRVSILPHEGGKDREVLATSGAYPLTFVTQIFHNGQPGRGCDRKTFEVMTNVHQPNHFAHKTIIWYDYLCPHQKKK